ncbi:MAG: allophanate hydrolase subunit 1 [Rhodobacter sp.]|nr:allophanate hydrolase subunit 1 [Rhodobacter sp.]
MPPPDAFPVIRDVGLTGKLVSFADSFSESANRAALAFRAALATQDWPGVQETATSLTSVFLRFDPLALSHAALDSHLGDLLARADWFAAPLPTGRTLWRIPTVLGGLHGPQFADAAQAAGRDPEQARADIATARVRVLTIGFAPGQPYMGQLPPAWDIPRMTTLNPQVPGASLVVAIRQLIIFAGPAPTGWRHIGQTAFRCFRPKADTPFALTPGDEVTFHEITPEELADIAATDETGDGGATREALT